VSVQYKYPRPALTVDIILMSCTGVQPLEGLLSRPAWVYASQVTEDNTEVLLIRRKHAPFEDCWALPGGFVEGGEALEQAAARELREETGLLIPDLEQFHCFSRPGRDPRGWTVTCAFVGMVDKETLAPQAADDAAETSWFKYSDLSTQPVPLAFDHAEILALAFERLQSGQLPGIIRGDAV